MPLVVIMAVPLGLLGTVAAVTVRGMEINVYTQIGIILLIALTCKTAILIAEFAKSEREKGLPISDAALTAARLRFRPILMTAFTFITGVIPLVVASGAGAAGRQAIGTAAFGGMVAATGLLVLFVPLFYVLVQRTKEFLLGKIASRRPPLAMTE